MAKSHRNIRRIRIPAHTRSNGTKVPSHIRRIRGSNRAPVTRLKKQNKAPGLGRRLLKGPWHRNPTTRKAFKNHRNKIYVSADKGRRGGR
jgi:hypothetical protein